MTPKNDGDSVTKKTRPFIEIKNLRKVYGTKDSLVALEDTSFNVYKGEFVVVVGSSGCGKTTLLKIIAGLIPKTAGDLFINSIPVEGPRRDIGVVFQSPNLMRWRSVIGNVMLPIEIFKLDQEEYLKKAMDVLEFVGLKGFEEKNPHELSGGMQQRVNLCRALIHDPPLLLMDEPFASLDELTRNRLNLELLRIWRSKKKTIVFVTHNISEAVLLAGRVIVMCPRPGRVSKILDIDLPRPRDLKMRGTRKFFRYTELIRGIVEA